MQYMGGKSKIAKSLSDYLISRLDGRFFVEPFCGGLNVTSKMPGPRIANDLNPYLFTLYKSIREGWIPPDHLSEEEYQTLKKDKDASNPLTAFAGYGCSFAGKWFGGYARRSGTSFASTAKKSLLKKMAACEEAVFSCVSYSSLTVDSRCLVYCDPPYANTTGYGAVTGFNNSLFWDWCRWQASKGVTVLVSEYKAPDDFKSVWSTSHTATVNSAKAGEGDRVIEHVFEYCGSTP